LRFDYVFLGSGETNMTFSSFSKKGYCVKSYGTGDKVKLPGPAADRPNVYEFGVTYDDIYNDLMHKDKAL
jgi:Ssu72-like protein